LSILVLATYSLECINEKMQEHFRYSTLVHVSEIAIASFTNVFQRSEKFPAFCFVNAIKSISKSFDYFFCKIFLLINNLIYQSTSTTLLSHILNFVNTCLFSSAKTSLQQSLTSTLFPASGNFRLFHPWCQEVS